MCNEERDYSVDTEVFEAVEKLLKNRVETCVQKECGDSTSTKKLLQELADLISEYDVEE